MIRLIKNEIIKIFHKKTIYVLGIITIIIAMLNISIMKAVANLDSLVDNDNYIAELEANLKNYDLNNEDDKELYLDEKTTVDVWKLAKKYDSKSWQYYLIDNNVREEVMCLNKAKMRNEEAEACQQKYDYYFDIIEKDDWRIYVEDLKKETIESINIIKDTELINDKKELEDKLNTFNITLDCYNYRLKNDIPMAYTNSSQLVDNYSAAAMEFNESRSIKEYKDYEEKLNAANVEKTYYETKYKLDNNIAEEDIDSAKSMFISETNTVTFFVLIVAVIIAGGIVAEEFNKGTIKQLLLKPYKRGTILFSKYISTIIVFILYLLFYYIVTGVAYGIASGFDSYNTPVIVYNIASKTINSYSYIKYCLLNILSVLPEYIVLITVSFALSTITTNGAVAIAAPLMVYFGGNILNSFIVSSKKIIFRYFPTVCWNWNEFLFGGLPSYQYAKFYISVLVTVFIIMLLYVLSLIIFNKKDIKNI